MVTSGKGIDEEVAASYESVEADRLALLPWTYRGKKVKLSGLVTDILHTNEGTWMTLRTGSYPSFAIVIVRYPERLPGLQKLTQATVYGLCAGTERMPSQLRRLTNLTIRRPLIRAEHVDW